MQKIRSKARRSAWYNDATDTVQTYNFFGRMNPNKKNGDVENRLIHPSSASPVEDRRRTGTNDFTPTLTSKSNTFGGSSSIEHLPPPPSEKHDAISNEKSDFSSSGEKESQDSRPAPPPTLDVKAANDTGTVDRSVGSESGPRKRKNRKFHNIFSKKKNNNNGENGSQSDNNGPDDYNVDNPPKKNKIDTSHITIKSQLRAVLASPINILLVCVPVGIALHNVKGINGIAVFVVNFIAIIPLAAMLSYSTEELALYVGEVLGGLLNASFGNAVELIVSVIALVQHKVLIVQTSLIGSMLSNLLLVLGMCFFFGGINRTEQKFNVLVAQTAASLLALAIGSLIIPTAFEIFSNNASGVTPLSRGTSVLLLIVYACYLLFQLKTHIDMYNETGEKTPTHSAKKDAGEANKGMATGIAVGAAATGGFINKENLVHDQQKIDDDEDREKPQLTKLGALVTLTISTVFVAICAEYMVSAINVVGQHISQEFIGLILLPIVGNAAEHATAVTVAIKDKMDLAIGVAVGSSLQIALLVLPLMVMLNWWGLGSPSDMTLNFDGFLVSVLFISIILVNYLIQDGKSHWLEGVMLQVAYLIIAVAAYFYPAKGDVAG